MYKQLLILLMFCTISCVQSINDELEQRTTIGKEDTPKTLENTKFSHEIIGTWIVQELLVNGKPDPENYPVKSDELTLNEDMTVLSIDKTFNYEETGTWAWVNDDFFMIHSDGEKILLEIIKLTKRELETKILIEGVELIVKYKKNHVEP